MQKIRTIRFFFENSLRRQYDGKNNSTDGFLGYIFINIQLRGVVNKFPD